MLGHRVVDGDDRVAQRAVGRHGSETDHAGGGLLGPADHMLDHLGEVRMDATDHIRAVIHGDLRFMSDRGVDVRVVGLGVLALDRVGADAVVLHERGRDIILRGERVARAQHDVGATSGQRAHEVRGLGGHVQARRHAHSIERLLPLEALADARQYRHVAVGPLDAVLAGIGE